MTRPAPLAKRTARKLRSLGATVVIRPLVKLSPVRLRKQDVVLALKADILMFTSQNAVEIFMKEALKTAACRREFHCKRFAAVGGGTTAALKKYGFRASYMPDTYTTRSLGRLLAKKIKKGTRIFYPCAKQHNRELVRVLRRGGAIVNPVIVYDITPVRYKRLNIDVDYVILTSSLTVRSLLRNASKRDIDPRKTNFICIGPVCARTLRQFGFTPIVPENSSISRIIRLLRQIKKC